ncbi:MAG: hypothetical protein K2X86_15495 [Cytophagaceae bacterium]|nr:hypothetical protein [Cytophagaceae bacterium]
METITVPILNESAIETIIERTVMKVLAEQQALPKKDESLITTQQVCDEFHVSRITLNNYQKSGKLMPFGKAGKQHTYKRCDCEEAFRHKLYAMKKTGNSFL